MAKAKRGRKKQQKINIDLAVVSMIVLSVLLAVLIYTNSGYIGEHLSPALGGIIGCIKYIIPIGTLALAVALACNSKKSLTHKLIQYALFLICIAVLMSIIQVNNGELNINAEFSKVVDAAYKAGTNNIGGGAIGIIIAIPLIKLFGILGAIIVSIGMAIILFIYMFGIRLADYILNFVEGMKERREARKKFGR